MDLDKEKPSLTCVQTFRNHTRGTSKVLFSPNAQILASSCMFFFLFKPALIASLRFSYFAVAVRFELSLRKRHNMNNDTHNYSRRFSNPSLQK